VGKWDTDEQRHRYWFVPPRRFKIRRPDVYRLVWWDT